MAAASRHVVTKTEKRNTETQTNRDAGRHREEEGTGTKGKSGGSNAVAAKQQPNSGSETVAPKQ